MNFKSTLTKSFVFAVLLAFAGNVSAQVFWSEDFAGGMPMGWTSEDVSPNYEALWVWCEGPNDPPTGNCSPIFGDAINEQIPFQATSAANGFMTVNSDGVATMNHGNDPHVSVLTSTPIDCSAEPVVWIKFETHIGTYELDKEDNAILQVSNDGGMNWDTYNVFAGVTDRWSDNPMDAIADISATAAGQAEVWLRWQWTGGWEYYWNMDDIILSSENPTAPNDMQVNANFYAHAPNAQTPISQIETFGFLADIENVGSEEQTGVALSVAIVDDAAPGTAVYEETLVYGTIGVDSLAENISFAAAGFTPPAAIASYTGTYTISADSADADLSNNSLMFDFEITNATFAKERGANAGYGSAAGNWDDDENFSWAYGCYYRITSGAGLYALEATFGVANSTADVAGRNISVKFYEWDDANEDGNVDPDERDEVGFANYELTGLEVAGEDGLITIPLQDVLTLENGIPLSDDTDYLVMLEYDAPDQMPISFTGSNDYDYGAQTLRTQALGAGMARYGVMLGVNDPLDDEIYNPGGFTGGFNVPVARLLIGALINNTELSAENKVKVFPSPAQDYVNLSLELTEMLSEVSIMVVDATGKVLEQRQLNNVQNDTYRFELANYPVGSYFLNVTTEEGSRNVPFVIAR